jgi:pyruvate/2-oxoglutarate dehydrogenase complex dihydrolipoamide dehydrogenase (E3) component
VTNFCDLVVIGGSTAGVHAAEFAAFLGLRVSVVDHRWPGPQPIDLAAAVTALGAAARTAHAARHAGRLGLAGAELAHDLRPVWRRARSVAAEIVEHDLDPARLATLGIELVPGRARLTGPNEVTVDESIVITTRFVLVCPHRRSTTTERSLASLFELDEPPRELFVTGGDGRLVLALAQSCARLGVRTTVRTSGVPLPRDEPALASALIGHLVAEGVSVSEPEPGADPGVGPGGAMANGITVVDTGDVADTADLGLAELGITVDDDGDLIVDERNRSDARTVYAVDPAAGHAAVRAVRDMFFPGRTTQVDVVPWCTFTDPELAGVGLTSTEAEARHGDDVDTWRIDLERNMRAHVDATAEGAVVVVTARDRIVGAHVLSTGAGDLVHELALAVQQGLKLADLANVAHVQPTISASVGMLADESLHEKAHRLRWLVRRR